MFLGRAYEANIIHSAIASKRAELGIVYGRRRVGKSSLLKHLQQTQADLYFEGLEGLQQAAQITHFVDQLAQQTRTVPARAQSWKDAFDAFTPFVAKGRHYVVFDEFPWMASERSELVSLLKFYWDQYWKNNHGLTLVLCGSVAQFMVKHLVHSRALHNRKTFEIKLNPLPAHEARLFFKGLRSDFEIAKFLMIFGGIPKYLEQLDPSRSLSDNLDRLCFQKNGFFVNEFETVFKEQFRVTKTYEEITRVLAKSSLSKENIAQKLKQAPGGGLTSYLKNLENADFVTRFSPLPLKAQSETKTVKYVLSDEWLRFYFTYMDPHLSSIRSNTRRGLFDSITASSIDTYFGLAFERHCFKNIPNLLDQLEIPPHEMLGYGPFFRQAPRSRSLRKKEHGAEGLQIDIVIHRRGHVLSIAECKFSSNPVGMEAVTEVERKLALLHAPKKYSIERILIAANGVTPQLEQAGYFHQILGLDALLTAPTSVPPPRRPRS
ncbi:ATP-binding protein [Bdellovibrionota bacterium FG-1]